jgi:hypothetical protein
MSDNLQILAALGLGMLLAGLLLSIGLYVGYKAARLGMPERPGHASRKQRLRLQRELKQCAALAQQVARHAEQLTAQLSAPAAGASRRLLGSASDVLEQSATLSLRLEQLLHGTRGKTVSPSRQPAAGSTMAADARHRTMNAGEEERSSLSAHELGQITEEHGQVASAGGAEQKHYAYDCVQTILPWTPGDVHVPSLAEGMAVRCASISGHGISFFWPTLPQFEHLIISLGSDVDLLFMAVQVESSKPAELDGAAMHLVECRFIRRMHELTQEWGRHLAPREDRAPAEAELIAG